MEPLFWKVAGFSFAFLILFAYRTAHKKKIANLPGIPTEFLLIFLALQVLGLLLSNQIPANLLSSIQIWATIFLYLAVARISVWIVFDCLLEARRGSVIPRITKDVILAILYVLVALIILKQKAKVDVASLLTTSAVISIVIGLALQDTLGNLFSGLALQLEKPYQIGDWVAIAEYFGQVVGMNWKSTLIQTGKNEIITIPNNLIAKSSIRNLSRPTPIHTTHFEIVASLQDPPGRVCQCLLKLLQNQEGVLKSPEPTAWVSRYLDHGIEYQATYSVPAFTLHAKIQAELLRKVWYALKRQQIQIPYPARNIHVSRTEPEQLERQMEETQKKVQSTLSKIDLFQNFDSLQLKALAQSTEVEKFGDGEPIVHQGDPTDSLYIIQKGECEVLVSTEGLTPEVVATLKEGQCFGEISLLTGERRSATVKANGDLEVIEIEKKDLAPLLEMAPSLADQLGEILARRQKALKETLARHTQTLEELTRLNSRQWTARIKSFFGLK